MRRPLVRQAKPAQQVTVSQSLPVPTGGWNTRDALSAMPPQDLIIATNVIVKPNEILVRPGWRAWATGLPAIGSFLPYNPATAGADKLFAAAGSGLYDVTDEGAPALVTGVTSSRAYWSSVNFSNASGHRLFAVNGQDPLIVYDGSSWGTTPTFGAISSEELTQIAVYNQRLYFLRAGYSSFYYLPAGSITGTLSEFNVGQVCKRGGHLVAIVTWTIDGGDGTDDKIVFITSEGEAIVYRGTDPSTVSTWSLQGVYYIGKLMNERCSVKFGGDVILLTELGVVLLSTVLRDGITRPQSALSYKIAPTLSAAAQRLQGDSRWDMVLIPDYPLLIVNVPETSAQQYVYHFESGAWSLFTGLQAYAWVRSNGQTLFATGDGCSHWTGKGDNGSDIRLRLLLSYNYFGDPARTKQVNLVRPIFAATGNFTYTLGCAVDFDRVPSTYDSITTARPLTQWGTALWGTGLWMADFTAFRDWRTLRNYPGRAFALYIETNESNIQTGLTGMDYLVSGGGPL